MSAGWSSYPFTVVLDIRFAKENSVLESGLCLYEMLSSFCENIQPDSDFNFKFLLVSSEISPPWVTRLISNYPSTVRFWQYQISNKKKTLNSSYWASKAFYKISQIIGQKFIWVHFDVLSSPVSSLLSSRKYRKDRLVYILSGNLYSSLVVRKKLFPIFRYKIQLRNVLNSMKWVSTYTDSGMHVLEKLVNKKKQQIVKLPYAIPEPSKIQSSHEVAEYRKSFLKQFISLDTSFLDNVATTLWVVCCHDPVSDLHMNWIKDYNDVISKQLQFYNYTHIVYINLSNYYDLQKTNLNENSKIITLNPSSLIDFNFSLLLQCSDIFLNKKLGSPYELLMLESVMVGCPMLYKDTMISDFSINLENFHKDYINKMENGLPEDWALQTLKLIIENRDLLSIDRSEKSSHKQHLLNVRKYYQKYYSWIKISKEWLEYFRKISQNIN